MNTETAIPPEVTDPKKPAAINRNTQTDIMNIAKLCDASGLSRPVIKRAIDEGEMKSFLYARQVCVLRTEYLRWLSSLGQEAA